MRTIFRSASASLWLSLFLGACSQSSSAPPIDDSRDLSAPAPDLRMNPDLADVLRPTCDDMLGGPELPANSTEAQPGFDMQLAMMDLSQLPPQLSLMPASDLNRAIVGYLLDKTDAELGSAIDRDATLLAMPLGKVVVAAFAAADPLGLKGPDLIFMRRGIHRFYHCARAYPMTLGGFRQTVWDYSMAPSHVVNSVPKAGPRRLYENPDLGVYVAETLIDDSVRETEIQVTKARHDGSHDFLAYDHDGTQVRTSTFAAGSGNTRVGPSPYTCMACHYDKTNKNFDLIVPN